MYCCENTSGAQKANEIKTKKVFWAEFLNFSLFVLPHQELEGQALLHLLQQ
jgi:hypothetical protein